MELRPLLVSSRTGLAFSTVFAQIVLNRFRFADVEARAGGKAYADPNCHGNQLNGLLVQAAIAVGQKLVAKRIQLFSQGRIELFLHSDPLRHCSAIPIRPWKSGDDHAIEDTATGSRFVCLGVRL